MKIRFLFCIALLIMFSVIRVQSQTLLFDPTKIFGGTSYGVYANYGVSLANSYAKDASINKIAFGFSGILDTNKYGTQSATYSLGYDVWNGLGIKSQFLTGSFALGQANLGIFGKYKPFGKESCFSVIGGVRVGFPLTSGYRMQYNDSVLVSTIGANDALKKYKNSYPVELKISTTMPVTYQLILGGSFKFTDVFSIIFDANYALFPFRNNIYESLDDERKFGRLAEPLPVHQNVSVISACLGVSLKFK